MPKTLAAPQKKKRSPLDVVGWLTSEGHQDLSQAKKKLPAPKLNACCYLGITSTIAGGRHCFRCGTWLA